MVVSGLVEDTSNHEVQTVGFVRIVGVNEKSRRQEVVLFVGVLGVGGIFSAWFFCSLVYP
jgi:hypothetical protein